MFESEKVDAHIAGLADWQDAVVGRKMVHFAIVLLSHQQSEQTRRIGSSTLFLDLLGGSNQIQRMNMQFRDLDLITRELMLVEFNEYQNTLNPFRNRGLSAGGIEAYALLVRTAIVDGNEQTLAESFMHWDFWNAREKYRLKGVERERNVNLRQTSERLGLTEFNTAYVRGFAKRLMNEGVENCQVYRAAEPKFEVAACTTHEGQTFLVRSVYEGYRKSYWPEPGDPAALTIPFGYGCHHTIGRAVDTIESRSGAA